MNELSCSQLDCGFGAIIRGLDLSKPTTPLQRKQLTSWLYQFKLLIIPEQQLSPQEYANFGRSWTTTTRIDGFTEMTVPGFEDINVVGNFGKLFEDEGYRNGAVFWHTDCAAEKEANATTMIYCIHSRKSGGETVFADMEQAYSALDAETKAQIDHLVAWHCYAGSKPILGGREHWEFPLTPLTDETAKQLPPPVKRPVVRTHSVTENRGLYAPAGSAFAIQGMEQDAAHNLMKKLKHHATQPEFCYSHHYHPGDLLLWDNTSTMHRASPVDAATGEHDRRMMHRICALGLPAEMDSRNPGKN